MKKADAIELLGGSVAVAAKAIGINPQAISQWPDVLPARLVDRVIAACVRTGIAVPDGVLGAKASVEVPAHG
ncbi:Cro/CI family transcriptional regulator [Comamonas sp. B-9]|uniref:Cro/CI family transcriptional regulator n=1 Tax=Comamonas sp. B-9 TaxID=1055192 RepID=UPI000395A1B1|nr:Cro/CI family transcriptional regulator [Comamonas sp. B-9]